MGDLKEIFKPIAKELVAVEKKIKQQLTEKKIFLSAISRHILSTSGKRLRPTLVLLSAQVGDKSPKQAIDLAAAVELIHTASLVQDDVLDQADLRRGKSAVCKVFGTGVSILFGDYLYSKAFTILSDIESLHILKILVQVTSSMAAGEIEQLRLAGQEISAAKCLEIIEKKTARLMAACCQTGAMIGGASVKQARALANFGLNFGLGFQIIDDCLDKIAVPGQSKKSAGLDDQQGKYTLPKVYNSIDKAVKKAEDYFKLSQQALKGIIEPAKVKPFIELGNFVLNQVK